MMIELLKNCSILIMTVLIRRIFKAFDKCCQLRVKLHLQRTKLGTISKTYGAMSVFSAAA